MATVVSSTFLVGVKDYLDSRQKVSARIDIDNINTSFIPDLFIVYCEEEDVYYQYKEVENKWILLDLDINEYLYELNENGEPDLTKPLYIEEDRMNIYDELVIQSWIEDGCNLTIEDDLLDFIIDDSFGGASDKTYSSENIKFKYDDLYKRFKEYADERFKLLNSIVYIKINSVDEMDRTDVFYLIENTDGSETFSIYILSEDGLPISLGSSEMDISGFQPLRDPNLNTNSKAVVKAINEVNTRYKKDQEIIGDYNNLAVPVQDSLYEASAYIANKAKTIGKVNELTTVNKTDIISSINELSSEIGLLKDLKTTDNSSIVSAINSFISEIINIGIIIPYTSNVIPENYLLCNGSLVEKIKYPLLYDLIGDTFGYSSDVNYFRLPDFRGRIPIGGPYMGDTDGEYYERLSLSQLGPHFHECQSESHYHSGYTSYEYAWNTYLQYGSGLYYDVSRRSDNNTIWSNNSSSTVASHTHTVYFYSSTHTHYSKYTGYGGVDLTSAYKDAEGYVSQPHLNIQPTMGLNYIIKAK